MAYLQHVAQYGSTTMNEKGFSTNKISPTFMSHFATICRPFSSLYCNSKQFDEPGKFLFSPNFSFGISCLLSSF